MPTKTLLAHKRLRLGLALLWTLFIGVLCLVDFQEFPTVSLTGADKYVHAIFYLIFTLLWFNCFKDTLKRALLSVFLAAIAYGILIEIMQGLFTQTRQADIKDVAANSFGAILAALIILLGRKYARNTI
jgi:VanZ family protein